MGIFDFLRGKQPEEEEVESSGTGPWPHRLARAQAAEDFDWDYDNERARKLVVELLTEAAPRFGEGKVKEIPDDDNVDLRGKWDGSPVRFAIWMSFGSFWAIEMKLPRSVIQLHLERNLEKVPKHGDADDPWEANEERRIFVGKGIFFEGDDDEVAQRLTAWAAFPDDFREHALAEMTALDASHLRCWGETASVSVNKSLRDLDDPIRYMERCARLLTGIRDQAPGSGSAAASSTGMTVSHPTQRLVWTRHTCNFCSSVYSYGNVDTGCPNCGAPAGR